MLNFVSRRSLLFSLSLPAPPESIFFVAAGVSFSVREKSLSFFLSTGRRAAVRRLEEKTSFPANGTVCSKIRHIDPSKNSDTLYLSVRLHL